MQEMSINLYDQEGIENTTATLNKAYERARQLGIRQLVVATTTGQTALDCAEMMPELDIIGVTMHAIDREIYVNRYGRKVKAKDPEIMERARQKGVRFYTGVHPFHGAVSSALRDALGGYSAHDVMAELLKTVFSTGTKVAIECAIMASDGGFLDMAADIIALGGYRGGADTALVLKPAYSYRMFEMRIREVLCYPRSARRDSAGG